MDEIRMEKAEAAEDARLRPVPPPEGAAAGAPAVRRAAWGGRPTTTDHQRIGALYLASAFVFLVVGGGMALMMRAELARPGAARRGDDPAATAPHEARHRTMWNPVSHLTSIPITPCDHYG
ncbi:hypothetical protein [Streptomyces caelestis]|uniref:hypothetical protein n=1 Tax=Streptomyces caelestis TaxID=36816 RepID=UPI003665D482